ncbi:MAG: MiaB/RimO family radical SAM methylthiotransferase [Spirochaetaceae bacterium]|nr:MiaB/RimO family radical SAM methylthiotransferase [Spirochaetaceae bacterium]
METGLPSVAFQTLGCKLNQCETETIAAAFTNSGFSIARDPRDAWLLVVNTCSVTSKAEQKGRGTIRAALKQNPLRPVIVTGCYTEVDRAGLEALDAGNGERRLFVVPGSQKSCILDMPAMLAAEGMESMAALRKTLTRICRVIPCVSRPAGESAAFRFDAAAPVLRSRAFLKVQDGCNNSCTYCLVRIARGPAQSLPEETVLERLRAAEAAGAAEAVLTGVNIGQWSGAANRGLAELLETLVSGTSEVRIRLSSLEPDVFTEKFFAVIQNTRILPHFHISVQSGSAEILKRMGRFYEPEAVLGAIRRLREIKDDPFVACDMIAGFPGETEGHFLETYNFCVSAGFAQVHAFPFSRRPGTAAWDYKPRIPEREAEKRVSILQNYAVLSRKRYVERWVGREAGGICISRPVEPAAATGAVDILTDNYLRVSARLPDDANSFSQKGRRLSCTITAPANDDRASGGAASFIDAYGKLLI